MSSRNQVTSTTTADADNQEEEEEEEDYMSAAFVDETATAKNTTTSLLWSRRHQVEHERHKKKLLSNPKSKRSIAELEVERREEALSKPIEAANKGFLMFQKMMSKSTDTTSPSSKPTEPTTTTQLTELITKNAPISVDLKADRLGLGHAGSKKRFKGGLTSSRCSDKPEDINRRFYQSESEFLTAKRCQTAAFYARKDYQKCQKVCANLEASIKEIPDIEWYWPKKILEAATAAKKPEAEEEAEAESEESPEEIINYPERLHELNDYLRTNYHYCIWCGVHFDSDNDLTDNCPGGTREDHD